MSDQLATNTTVDEAFEKFTLRRRILVKALITDYKSFQKTLRGERYCGPVGLVERWEVKLPDELLAKLPPVTMPLNFTCHQLGELGWLALFTTHCDAWLRSVALNSDGLDKNGREGLFKKINNMPIMYDVVCEVAKMNVRANKSKSNSEADERELKRQKTKQSNREAARQSRLGKQDLKKENDILRAELNHIKSEYKHLAQKASLKGDEDEGVYAMCDACGFGTYASSVFWIWCDTCEKDTILCYCNSCSPEDKCKSCKNKFAMVVKRPPKSL